MISLVCGTALPEGRSRLFAGNSLAETIFITPDLLRSGSLAREVGTVSARIMTLEDVINKLKASIHFPTISDSHIRSLVRLILESTPVQFDRLYGSYSAPRLTEGVLSYIISGLRELSEDETDSPRIKQLRHLKYQIDQSLSSAEIVPESTAIKQFFSTASREDFTRVFPNARQLIFSDFQHYNDIIYLLISTANRFRMDCQVYLDYFPEDDAYPGGPLESAYMVLYEMADQLFLDEKDFNSESDIVHSSNYQADPIVIDVPNISQEIDTALLLIQKYQNGNDSREHTIVIGIPQSDLYSVWLRDKLVHLEDKCRWINDRALTRSQLWHFLSLIGTCCKSRFSVSDLASIIRSPYYRDPMENAVYWDLASKLEFLISPETELRSVQDLQQIIEPYMNSEGRYNLLNPSEMESLNLSLSELKNFLEAFRRKDNPVGWAELLLDMFRENSQITAIETEVLEPLLKNLHESIQIWQLINSDKIGFDRFLRMLKSSMSNAKQLQPNTTAGPITICSYADAAAFKSDFCLLLGCNDGNLPRLNKQEAIFLTGSRTLNHHANLARQFDYIRNCQLRSKQLMIFVPEHEGTEELLESQFIAPLLSAGAERLSLSSFLERYKLHNDLPISQLDEVSETLRSVELTSTDEKRFRPTAARSVIHSIFVNSQRSSNHLTTFDGLIDQPALANWLESWTNNHIYSISQLDKSIGCSLRFFMERILNLKDDSDSEELISSSFYGSFVHDTLAIFYREWVQTHKFIVLPDQESEARQLLTSTYESLLSATDLPNQFTADLLETKMFGELGVSGFHSNFRSLDEVDDPGALGTFLMMEIARAVEPGMEVMIPSHFEVGFGLGIQEHDDGLTQEEYVELSLPNSESIKLRGRIDRIDVSTSGHFAVTDYKTGNLPLRRQVLEGFKTQLPIYTLVAQELLRSRFAEPESAGGLYYSLKRAERNKVNGMFLRAQYKKALGVTGNTCLSDEDYDTVLHRVKTVMSRSIKDIRAGYLTHTRYDADVVCPFCPLEKLCYRNVERMADLMAQVSTETES